MNQALQVTPEALLESVRRFVQNEVLPNTRVWEEATSFPDDIWPRLAELGLLEMTLPQDGTNRSVSCEAYCDICCELAKGDPALAMNVAAINALCVAHLARFGTPEQQQRYLSGVISGRIKMAWGLTEPDAGSDARRVRTVASMVDGEPLKARLNGRKMFITNGGKADLIIIIARTGEKELGAFLLETNQPGFQLDARIHTVGVSASNTVAFSLKDAEAWQTPCTFEEATSLLYRGRLGIAAMALGIAEKAHELAAEYAQRREQFNRRLCDMQSVQNMIADSEVEVSAARLLIREAARRYDAGLPIVKESSIAKLYASETANRVTNRAIQIHGGRGMTREFLVEKLWRDAKLTEIGEGCSEIQRMIISKQVCR